MTVVKVTNAKLKGDVKGPTFTGAVDGATFTGDVTYDETVPPIEPPPSGNYANAETNALASTISPAPPASWLTAVDTLISTLKTASIWQTFDLFYHLAAPSNLDAGTYNWVNTATGRLTANGTINYVANQYVASNGTTGWYSSSFNVNSGKAVDGNSAFGYFVLNECTTDDISPFQSAGAKHFLGLKAAGASAVNNIIMSLNTSTPATLSSVYGSTAGHWVAQQNTTTQLEAYLDGKSIGTRTQTHSADTGAVQIFKTASAHYTTRQTAFVHYGSKLTAPQQLTLSKALYTFLATAGVRPKVGVVGSSKGPTNVAPYKHLPTGNGNSMHYPINSAITTSTLQCRAGSYPYSIIKVTDPNYVNVFRIETHPGDGAPFDGSNPTRQRVQFNTLDASSFVMGDVVDASFSFWIETGSSYGFNSWCTITDSHDQSSGVSSGPAFMLNPGDGKFYFACYDNIKNVGRESPKSACNQGVWHHVRMAFQTGNATSGWIKGWFDGTQTWNFTGVVGNPAYVPLWWNLALYSGDNNPGSLAVWLANWEVDHSGTLPFASRVANPLPCPPLT